MPIHFRFLQLGEASPHGEMVAVCVGDEPHFHLRGPTHLKRDSSLDEGEPAPSHNHSDNSEQLRLMSCERPPRYPRLENRNARSRGQPARKTLSLLRRYGDGR